MSSDATRDLIVETLAIEAAERELSIYALTITQRCRALDLVQTAMHRTADANI